MFIIYCMYNAQFQKMGTSGHSILPLSAIVTVKSL